MTDLMVSRDSLEEADRQLAMLADACMDHEDSVPSWVIAARRSIQRSLQECESNGA